MTILIKKRIINLMSSSVTLSFMRDPMGAINQALTKWYAVRLCIYTHTQVLLFTGNSGRLMKCVVGQPLAKSVGVFSTFGVKRLHQRRTRLQS